MMDFMESLRRGVDRAGFEVDRLLRANRVRSSINSLRSQVDEEMRQIGYRVFELYQQGELVHPELQERCDRVKQYQKEMADKEQELETINQEGPDFTQEEPTASQKAGVATCPNCGARTPENAAFCPQCGTRLRAAQIEAVHNQAPDSPKEAATASTDNDDL